MNETIINNFQQLGDMID